jgi:hypothetical protein
VINITETRKAIKRSVQAHTALTDSTVSVRLGPSKYAVARSDSSEMEFVVTLLVDKEWASIKYPMDDLEDVLDRWLAPEGDESLKQHLEQDANLKDLVSDVTVTRTSGHQLYQETGGPPRNGATWTVKTLA